MCTLIVGRDILGPRTMVVAANRDEEPERASEPPGVLCESPRVVGGRDRVAGGTWLAIREGRAAVAMLNRRPLDRPAAEPSALRSRGRLALDVATTPALDPDLAAAALARARSALAIDRFAPFSLALLAPDSAWVLAHDGGAPADPVEIGPGWHVLTHADLDDPTEPRTAALRRALATLRPAGIDEARDALIAMLADHGDAEWNGRPPVCTHEGRMVTVSSSLVFLAGGESRYWHVEGHPCEGAWFDCTDLLAGRGMDAPRD